MTLIEVMAALVITTVGLLGALAMIGIVIRGASFSRNVTEASVLAQSMLEQAVSLPVGSKTGPLPTPPTDPPMMDANGIANTNGPYSRTTVWSNPAPGSMRVCTVTVSWTDPLGATHSVVATRQQALQ